MSPRVLVVDDTPLERAVLTRAVTRLGYDAEGAADGGEALARLRMPTEPIDVVLLDLVMPEVDGYETLREIKSESGLDHVPVIMVSAVDDTQQVIRCIEVGATDYLTKPVHGPLLRARLRASLAAKQLRDVELDHLAQVDVVIRAAVAVEAGSYDAGGLEAVVRRDDALGTLARVFQRMTREVASREEALRRQVAELHIEIDQRRRRQQVSEVTGSDYFRRLVDEAAVLKRILTDESETQDG